MLIRRTGFLRNVRTTMFSAFLCSFALFSFGCLHILERNTLEEKLNTITWHFKVHISAVWNKQVRVWVLENEKRSSFYSIPLYSSEFLSFMLTLINAANRIDKSKINLSDAVIFHSRDIPVSNKMPTKGRRRKQRWVFYTSEKQRPEHKAWERGWWLVWTLMQYRLEQIQRGKKWWQTSKEAAFNLPWDFFDSSWCSRFPQWSDCSIFGFIRVCVSI